VATRKALMARIAFMLDVYSKYAPPIAAREVAISKAATGTPAMGEVEINCGPGRRALSNILEDKSDSNSAG
jgi:hypothetical protein